jgi:heme/copper-type cytochrome/quinol oxidase subunit 3
LGALAWALRPLRRAPRLPVTAAALTHVAVFWHFVGALWLYLLVVLTIL